MSEIRILHFVNNMKPKTSYGEDLISNKILKFIAPSIIQPLKHLINLSLKTGYFPDKFKIAKIIPIFKDSDKHEFCNYRPISLLNSLSRLIESIVCFQVTGFTDVCEIFYKHQYGFRARHSVIHPLLHFSENILNSLNEGKINLTFFIDLKKAFDTVNYEILLAKLENYGIRNNELLWFRNYLTNRQQYVHISNISGSSNVKSCMLNCECGIPQGSCLGPLLFLFFINDLATSTNFFTLLFADDCTFQISGANTPDLFKRANEELLNAENWFSANKLTLNTKKTRYILYKSKHQHVHANNLFIGNNIITRAGSNCEEKYVRFLGIWIDDNMSFVGHIEKLKSKLNSGLYALSTCNKIVPLKIRKLIYRSLIESHLHFGSVIYGAANPKLLQTVETLQRKAVRLVARTTYNAHTDPLFKQYSILKLNDLVNLDQNIFVRQFKNGKLPPSFKDFFYNLSSTAQKTRDDDYNLEAKHLTNNLLFYYPSVQLIRNWNRNTIVVKAQAEISLMKSEFKICQINKYEDECVKLNCYVCSRTY